MLHIPPATTIRLPAGDKILPNQLTNNGENIFHVDNLVFFVVVLHFSTAVTAGQNNIADLYVHGDFLAVVVTFATSDGDYGIFLWLFWQLLIDFN